MGGCEGLAFGRVRVRVGGGHILREILTCFHHFYLHLVCSLKFLLTFLVPISIMVRATQNILFLLQLTEIETASCLFFHVFSSLLVIQRLQSICFLDNSSLVCFSFLVCTHLSSFSSYHISVPNCHQLLIVTHTSLFPGPNTKFPSSFQSV